MRLVEILIVVFVKLLNVDAQFLKQVLRLGAVELRCGDGLRAAIAEQGSLGGVEFIAARMAAEIVVVFENQNFRVGTGDFSKEIRGGEAADAATHNNQVVGFGILRGSAPGVAVAQGVADFHDRVGGAAHAGQRRRVILIRSCG